MQQNRYEVKTVASLVNVALADSAVVRAMAAPRHLPRMLCFSGKSGFGKTSAAAYLRSRHRAYYVECKSTWTRKKLLEDILKDMGIPPARTIYDMCDQICLQLAASGRPLIIDEMDYLVDKSAVEIVRDIYDGSKGVVMIIGEERLPAKLQRWERFHGRIMEWVQARPADMDDALLLAEFYCRKVKVGEDIIALIHQKSEGSVRRICVNLELVQAQAMSVGLDAVTLVELPNLTLYNGKAPMGRG
jgi:chromosomal replication initiation ATPase DnaA